MCPENVQLPTMAKAGLILASSQRSLAEWRSWAQIGDNPCIWHRSSLQVSVDGGNAILKGARREVSGGFGSLIS